MKVYQSSVGYRCIIDKPTNEFRTLKDSPLESDIYTDTGISTGKKFILEVTSMPADELTYSYSPEGSDMVRALVVRATINSESYRSLELNNEVVLEHPDAYLNAWFDDTSSWSSP